MVASDGGEHSQTGTGSPACAGAEMGSAGLQTGTVEAVIGERLRARRDSMLSMFPAAPVVSAIEGDLRSLVVGLEHPEGLEVNVAGDAATVQIPGGHEVKLKREAGVWHVEDFD